MKTFLQHITENTTANMVYLNTGAGFAIDTARGNFDVDQWGAEHSKMKPWEVRNAEEATTRRTHLLQWMRASNTINKSEKNVVDEKSVPLTPDWQSRKR